MHKIPHTADTPIQETAVNGSSFTATKNQVRNPVTAIARTFEKIQPLSSNPQKSLPVTGIASIPMRKANIHQVQKVHTSPFSKYADSPTRAAARNTLGTTCFICVFLLILSVTLIRHQLFYISGFFYPLSHRPSRKFGRSKLPDILFVRIPILPQKEYT